MKRNIPLFKKIGIFLIILAGMLIGAENADGATYYSRVSGAFATAGTWSISPTGSPTNTTALTNSDIFIVQSPHTVTLTGSRTVASITVNTGGILVLNNRTLTVSGAVSNAGTITVTTGRISQSGTSNFTNSGSITFTGTGRLYFTGSFNNTGTLNLASALVYFTGANATSSTCSGFTTTGTVTYQRTAGSVTFTGNVSGGAFTKSGNGTLDLGSGLTHTFTGTWTRTAGVINGNSSLLRIGGSMSGTGGTFIAGTGTVEWNRSGTQTIANVAYYDLILSGTSAKTIPAGTSISGNLSISPDGAGATTASIVTGQNITVGSLTLGGIDRACGTWGSTSSSATNNDNTYFAATTGYLTVGDMPSAPVVGTITQPTCAIATGSVDLSGLPSGIWTINPGSISGSGSSTTISGLVAGTYNFTVTNSSGCTSLTSGNVVIDALPTTPSAPTVGLITQPTCGTATATVDLSGLPTSAWTVTASPGGATLNGSTATANFSGLPANTTYTFTVTLTSSGCTSPASGSAVVNAQPVAPAAPTIGTITQPTCAVATGSAVLSGLPSTGTWTLTRFPGGIKTNGTGTSTILSDLPAGTYTFTVTNEDNSTSCPGSGNGLTAEYFNNMTLTAPSALVRTDATVDFDWGNGSPDGTISTNNFSVRWTGKVQPCYSETYTFTTRSDDGIRLWVNGTQIINNWGDHGPTNDVGNINLLAGQKYDIVLEFYENGGGAVAQLSWNSPSQPIQIIPQSQLCSEATGCSSPVSANVVINAQPTTPSAPTVGLITQPTCGTATATVELSGLPTSAWTVTANPGGATLNGSTATANFSGLPANATYTFTVTLASSGCTSPASGSAVVNAQPVTPTAPTITPDGPTTFCAGGSVTLTSSAGSSYLWSTGATTPSINVTSSGSYTVRVTNAAGCQSAPSAATTVTVNSYPIVFNVTGGGTYCSGGTGIALGLSGSQNGVNYQLFNGTASVGAPVAGTGSPISFGNQTSAGTYTVVATSSPGNCTQNMNGSAFISISPAIPALTASINNTTCPTDANGAITVTSSVNNSVEFKSAENDFINLGATILSGKTSFTLEGWVRFNKADLGSRMSLFGQNDAIEFGFSDANNIMCWSAGGGSVSVSINSYPSDYGWHHLAVVGNGTNMIIYIDGGQVASGGSVTSNYGSDTNFSAKIGSGVWDGSGGSFTGQIKKVGFWSIALTSSQLATLASGPYYYTGTETGLIAGYNFSESSGTNLSSLPSGTTGTFIGTPEWVDILSYNWTKSGDASFSRTTKDLSGLTTGEYNLSATNGICTNSNSFTVSSVNTNLSAVSISPNSAQSICISGTGTTLTATETGGGAITSRQWGKRSTSGGAITTIAGQTASTYTPTGASLGIGTWYVVCTSTPTCGSATTSNEVTVTVNPNLPVSVSIGASTNPVCAGTSVTYTATPANGGATPAYQWQVNGINAGSNSTLFSYIPANSDVITCILTSNATCATGSPATSNAITMDVSAEPTIANAGPDQTGGSTCGLTSIVLAANTPITGSGVWTIESGVGGSLGNSASPGSNFSGNPGSTYTLRWTISNGVCTSSYDETVVTFNTIPTITGTSPGERCDAGSVTLGATASAGTINWYNNPTGGSSIGTGTTFATPVISTSTTYYVDATSNGCTTGSRTAVTATVHDLPSITVSPDATICSGSNTTLTAVGGTSYVWSPSTGLSSSSGASVIASPTATTTYTVTGTDTNGCSNTASTTVTVNELPTFLSVNASCALDLLSYSVSVTVSSGNLTSTEGIVNNTSGNDWTVSSIPSGTNTTLTVSDANSCLNTSMVTAPDCSCPIINAPISGGNQQYCTGSPVPEISASVAAGETVDWYSVSSGGTSISTGLTYTPSSAGTYYAEARNTTSNCKSSTRTAITITENPNASISLTSGSGTDGQTVCINSPIANITYLVGGGGANAGVTGLPSGLSGNYNAGVFTISGNPTASGTFNYTVTTTGTCSQTSANGTVTVDQGSVGGTISGVTSSICLGTSTGTMTLNAYTGTILRWERQINSGGWNSVGNGGNTTFSETPYSSGTWEYRTIVQNGVCAPEYSSIFSIDVDPTTVAGWITSSSYDPVCEGASTPTLTLNGSTGSILRWEKQLNSGVWQNIANTSTTFSEVPSSGGTWGYRALVQSGTCSPAYQTPFTVVVNPTLTITLGSNPEICEGTTIAYLPYTATTGNPTSYSIDFDPAANTAGFTDFSGWGFSASPLAVNVPWNAAPGDYNGSLTIGTSYPVCVSQVYPIHITVNPIITASVVIATDVNPVCAGIPVTFTATPTNGGTTPSYQWKVNGNNVGSNSATYTDATLANGDLITCEMTSNASCITGSPATSNTVTMTVNPNLPVSVSIGASANPVCSGTSVTFTATPINGGLAPTYQWKKNGGNVGSNSTTYTDATLANGDLITCELTSNATCATGNPATSNTVTLTVNPNLPVSVSIDASANPVCAGNPVTFTATPANGGTTPAYQWIVNGNNAGSNSSTFTYSPSSGDAVSCELTSNATCATGSPATSNTVIMTVNPNLPVGVSIGASANPVCSGTSVTFSATPTNGGLTPTYQWKKNGGYVGSNSTTYTDAALANGDLITCELTSNATCATGSPATSNTVTMTVNSFSAAPTGISGITTICEGSSTTLTLSGGTAGTGATAEWFTGSCGGTFAGSGNSITVSPASSTTYFVRYNGTCNTTTCASVLVTVNSLSEVPTGITGTTTICEGSSTTLTLSGGTAGTGATAEWFTGSCGGTFAGSGNSITVTPASSTTYYVRYTGTCNTTSCASVLVSVYPNPTVDAGGAVSAICQGDTSEALGGSFGGGATSAVWSDGGAGGVFSNNDGSTPGNTTYTASLSSGNIVTLTLTSNGGPCGEANDSKQITVNPLPTPGEIIPD